MTKTIRRTQAERTEQMRARLAKAAYDVIAERGHSRFRTAAVIEHAGVSQGALQHHFPTKNSLTLAAVDYAINLDRETSEQRASKPFGDAAEVLQAMALDLQDFFWGNRFWVTLDITMDAAKNKNVAPAIRAIVAEARRPVYATWTSALTRCGWSEEKANTAVASTAALISGFAIRTLWNDDKSELEEPLQLWLQQILASA